MIIRAWLKSLRGKHRNPRAAMYWPPLRQGLFFCFGICFLTLTACGFHLSGQGYTAHNVKTVLLDAPEGTLRDRVLRHLGGQRVAWVKVSQEPVWSDLGPQDVFLHIFPSEWEESPVGLSRDMRATQLRLTYMLSYELGTRANGRRAERLSLVRDFSIDPNQLLGQSTVREKLRREMEAELVRQLMNHVWAVIPSSPQG